MPSNTGLEITTTREMSIRDTKIQLQKVEFHRPRKKVIWCIQTSDACCHVSVPFSNFKDALTAFTAMSLMTTWEDGEEEDAT